VQRGPDVCDDTWGYENNRGSCLAVNPIRRGDSVVVYTALQILGGRGWSDNKCDCDCVSGAISVSRGKEQSALVHCGVTVK